MLRLWLFGLNAVLILSALGVTVWVSRRGLVLLALIPIAFMPFCYARLRLHRALAGSSLSRRHWIAPGTLLALGCLLDAITVAQLLTARASAGAGVLASPIVSWVGPVWFSAHALLFGGYAVGALARRTGRPLARLFAFGRSLVTATDQQEVSLERRQFLQHFGAVGAGLPFFVSVSGAHLSYDFRVEQKEIVLPRWPRALDGLRVAHLSDIHVGGAMDRDRLLEVAALTNAQRPDLVLHTGDFLTHRSGNFDAPLYEALAGITAPLGQWASLGNHDFDNPERLVTRLRDAGVTVLRNAMHRIAVDGTDLEIAGLDFLFWRPGQADAYQRIMSAWGPRSGTARLLLNHDPRTFSELPADSADLVLSGHTHGGHVGVQLGPSQALTVIGLLGIPDQGIFQRGEMHMFVTRCVGFYGYPIRLGIPPEIAILTLRSPASPAQHVA